MPLISSSKRFAFFITCVHSLFLRGRAPSLKKNLLDSFTSFCSFSLFNFQGPASHLLGDSFYILPQLFDFVNTFFTFLFKFLFCPDRLLLGEIYITPFFYFLQVLFSFFYYILPFYQFITL